MTDSIGPLQPAEVPDFCALFQRVFSVPLTPALREWKYVLGPRLGSISLVARGEAGALVGHAGALIFPGLWAGRTLPMAQVCDVMVDASARGGVDHGGVYGRLMAALQAELARTHPGAFAYGFAGIRPYKLGARMGLYRAVQPCRMGTLAFTEPSRTGLSAPWSLSATPVSANHPAFGSLWARLGPRGAAPAVARTPAYLNWRYAMHPVHRYQPWLLRRWGRTLGWVITRPMPDGSLCLVDSLLPAGLGARQAAACVAGALARAEPSPAVRVGSWAIETEESARLEPIMGCEVRVDRWHSDHLVPRFQPGDTDVF